MKSEISRREFLNTTAGAAVIATPLRSEAKKPALLGGIPVRTAPFPSWPISDSRDEKVLLGALHSGKWYRRNGKLTDQFEAVYAQLTGSKFCLATANGTSALIACMGALGIGPGDEVIVPPYTFIATVNAVLMFHALPIFVDTDPATFQIDPAKIDGAITKRTALILPVHIGGSAADLGAILKIGQQRNLPVLEDACQAHLGEWQGRKLGTYGIAGCFSFQGSKNLNCGEGGAVLMQDARFAEQCRVFHDNSRLPKSSESDFSYHSLRGANLRMTEFQAGLLLAQMTRLEEQSRRREQNAQYLTAQLSEIAGISPARMYTGCTRNAYHLYMSRYRKEQFAGLLRSKFLKALRAEGIPAGAGYMPLNKEPFLTAALQSRGYQAVYGKEIHRQWQKRTECPENDRLCQEGVWFTQTMLLGNREDMDQIVEAIHKIKAYAGELAKT